MRYWKHLAKEAGHERARAEAQMARSADILAVCSDEYRERLRREFRAADIAYAEANERRSANARGWRRWLPFL